MSQLEGKYYSEIAMSYFDFKDEATIKYLLIGGNNYREVMLISVQQQTDIQTGG
jgi:hypothetical protein